MYKRPFDFMFKSCRLKYNWKDNIYLDYISFYHNILWNSNYIWYFSRNLNSCYPLLKYKTYKMTYFQWNFRELQGFYWSYGFSVVPCVIFFSVTKNKIYIQTVWQQKRISRYRELLFIIIKKKPHILTYYFI